MFKNNQILYMCFQCTDVYGCPKLLDMSVLEPRSHKLVAVKDSLARIYLATFGYDFFFHLIAIL